MQLLGTVCGVQSSIQAGCETFSFLAGVFLKDPSEFWALMLGSLCVVSIAWLLYAIYMSRWHRGEKALALLDSDDSSQLRLQHEEERKGLLSQEGGVTPDFEKSPSGKGLEEQTQSFSDSPSLKDET
jgi:hypothetical protein